MAEPSSAGLVNTLWATEQMTVTYLADGAVDLPTELLRDSGVGPDRRQAEDAFPARSVPVQINALLIETADSRIMVDARLGPKSDSTAS